MDISGSGHSLHSQCSHRCLKQPILRSLAVAVALALSGTASAATFTVSNINNSGGGSLRQAVLDANAAAGADNIVFTTAPGSTITLSTELLITKSLTITGPTSGDPSSITINGGGNSRIFRATIPATENLTLENMTLTNGQVNDRGGAVRMGGSVTGTLILNDTVVTGNSTSGNLHEGGGLYVENAHITLNRSTISNNSTSGNNSPGGGIFANEVIVTLNDSTISGNSTTGYKSSGGGFYSDGAATFNNSTISGNSTTGSKAAGGGLYIFLEVTLNQSAVFNQTTVSGNSTSGSEAHGGGIAVFKGDTILNQSTITGNTSSPSGGGGGGLFSLVAGYTVSMNNTILSGNTGFLGNFLDGSFAGTVNANNSIFGDYSSEITGTNTLNIFNNAPGLGSLQNNGGTTLTHLPNVGSIGLNKGSNTSAAPFNKDQRGFNRIQNTTVDIGSVEVQLPGSQLEIVKRASISKPILLAKHGVAYNPPAASGTDYGDVKITDFNSAWIEQLKVESITEGCAANKFCPDMVVTKEQLAKIILKAKGITPGPATGIFTDVPLGSFNVKWIDELSRRGYTTGCAFNKFCPKEAVSVEVFENILNSAYP